MTILAILLATQPAPVEASFLDTLGNLWNRGTEAVGGLWERGKETVSGWLGGRRAKDISGLLEQVEKAQQEVHGKAVNLADFMAQIGSNGPGAATRPYLEERIRDLETSRQALEGLYAQLGPVVQEAQQQGALKPEDATRVGKIQRDQATLVGNMDRMRQVWDRWPASPPAASSGAGSPPSTGGGSNTASVVRGLPPASPGSPGTPSGPATSSSGAPPAPTVPAGGQTPDMLDQRSPDPTPAPAGPVPPPSPTPSPSAPVIAASSPATAPTVPTGKRFADDARLLDADLSPNAPPTREPVPVPTLAPVPTSAPAAATTGNGAAEAVAKVASEERTLASLAKDSGKETEYGASSRPDEDPPPATTVGSGEASAEVKPAPEGTGGTEDETAGTDAAPTSPLPSLAAPIRRKGDGPIDPDDPETAALIDSWLAGVGLDSYGRYVAPPNITARGPAETDGRTRTRYVWDTLQADPAGSGVSLGDFVRRRLNGEAVALAPPRQASPTALAPGRGPSGPLGSRSKAAYQNLGKSLTGSDDRAATRSAYESYKRNSK